MGSPGLKTRRGDHMAVLEIGPSARSGRRGNDGGVGVVWSEG